MDEALDWINVSANITSAGTSQLTVNTSEGLEQIEIENLSELDSELEHTDLGKLYDKSRDDFIKMQQIRFRNQVYFYCYFNNDVEISILKFDSNGKHLKDK